MSREWSTFRCKLENFEAIIKKWRKLGYKVYPRYLRDDDTLIVGKYKINEEDAK